MLEGARPSDRAALDGQPDRKVASIAARLSNDLSSFIDLRHRETGLRLCKYLNPRHLAMLNCSGVDQPRGQMGDGLRMFNRLQVLTAVSPQALSAAGAD